MQSQLPDNNEMKFRTAAWVAGVAGVLMVVITALLAYDYSQRTAKDPLESAAFAAYRTTLAGQPKNEELKKEIRTIDFELRREYFRQKTFTHVGATLLLVAFVIFILAGKTAITLHRRLPQPQPLVTLEDTEAKWTGVALWSVGGLLAVLVVAVLALRFTSRSALPDEETLNAMLAEAKGGATTVVAANNRPAEKTHPAEPSKEGGPSANASRPIVANPPAPPPTEEEIAKNWPRFRGPGGGGISAFTNIPTEWNAMEGSEKNLRWKAAVPLPGNGSPVVWKDRVFLSGADENRREVYCFEAKTGNLVWQKPVPATPASAGKFAHPPDAGYAAPTIATDGRWVFAIFANGDLAAFGLDGEPVWSKNLGMPDSIYGYASSPTTYRDLLIVQYDQGSGKETKSKLFAFRAATGEIAWQVDRAVPNSWASPIVIRAAGRDQIVTAANPWVIAYDPTDGKEIWRAKCLQGDIGASPTFAAGTVFTANDGDNLSAIPADGQGDVTAKIRWRGEDGIPDTCSPLANEEYVLLLDASGTLTCYDQQKGEKLWDESFDEGGGSSPSFVGKRVYVFGKSGKAWVVEPGREKCERIAENSLGEGCDTSPAYQDGCFYIRGSQHLFCIGEK
jgi:outer membrane protein assembly factor BamB